MSLSILGKLIDSILQIRIVQYILLTFFILSFIVNLIYKSRIGLLNIQLDSAKNDKAEYGAYLLTQNAAIVKQGQDMQKLFDKLKITNSELNDMKNKLKIRQHELHNIILKGDCPEMVQQVIDEVRK